MTEYRLKVVTRPGAGLGFRLAGVPVEEVSGPVTAERLAALVEEPGLGILAIDEELLGGVPQDVLERVSRDGVPIVLPFTLPARWGERVGGEEYVSALIRRAIGYHIKIQP
ncbi:MAG: V-type ATP synthase subunit F [Acidobacteria bacterium]|nr:V-type ATP synthase subunit F [Acidobacteriota bacterium]